MDSASVVSWLVDLRSRVARHEFLTNVARLGSGTAIGQGLVLVAAPAITRLYSPSEIGTAGLFTSFLLMASTVASLRYELAVGVTSAEERDLLGLLSCWLTIPVGVISAMLLAVLIESAALGLGALPYWSVPAMAVLVCITGIFSTLRYWHVARSDFSGIGSALIQQGAGRALLPIIVAPLGLGWGGLLVGEAGGRLLGIRRLARDARPGLAAASRLGTARLRACLVRYWQFPLTFLPSTVLDAASSAVVLPVVASLFGVPAAGLLALAQRVMFTPGALVSGSVADVYQARFVNAARRDPGQMQGLLKSGAFHLAALAAMLYVPAAALSVVSFSWIFGARWAEAGLAAAALTPAAVTGLIITPLSRAILLSRIPQVKLLADACRLVLPLGALYIGHHLQLAFVRTTLLYALLRMVADGIYLCVIWYSVAPARQRLLA